MIAAFKPEELAVSSLQESRFQVSNLNLEIHPKLGSSWKKIIERYAIARTNLTADATEHAYTAADLKEKMKFSKPANFLAYLKQLRVSLTLVLEYSNYALQINKNGSVNRVLNRLPAIGPSGYDIGKVLQLQPEYRV